MKLKNCKKQWSIIVVLLSSFSGAASAHPGHTDIAAVHGKDIGVWVMHQIGMDSVLTILTMALVAVLVGGCALFRRRRPRRQLISS